MVSILVVKQPALTYLIFFAFPLVSIRPKPSLAVPGSIPRINIKAIYLPSWHHPDLLVTVGYDDYVPFFAPKTPGEDSSFVFSCLEQSGNPPEPYALQVLLHPFGQPPHTFA